MADLLQAFLTGLGPAVQQSIQTYQAADQARKADALARYQTAQAANDSSLSAQALTDYYNPDAISRLLGVQPFGMTPQQPAAPAKPSSPASIPQALLNPQQPAAPAVTQPATLPQGGKVKPKFDPTKLYGPLTPEQEKAAAIQAVPQAPVAPPTAPSPQAPATPAPVAQAAPEPLAFRLPNGQINPEYVKQYLMPQLPPGAPQIMEQLGKSAGLNGIDYSKMTPEQFAQMEPMLEAAARQSETNRYREEQLADRMSQQQHLLEFRKQQEDDRFRSEMAKAANTSEANRIKDEHERFMAQYHQASEQLSAARNAVSSGQLDLARQREQRVEDDLLVNPLFKVLTTTNPFQKPEEAQAAKSQALKLYQELKGQKRSGRGRQQAVKGGNRIPAPPSLPSAPAPKKAETSSARLDVTGDFQR